jgi:transcriptional regulator with XRE-family HTH domain
MGHAYRTMLNAFEKRERAGTLSQDKLAKLLSVDKSLISRRLKGAENLTLRTLSYMAKAMNCRLLVEFKPYEEIGIPNSRYDDLNNPMSVVGTNTANISFNSNFQAA